MNFIKKCWWGGIGFFLKKCYKVWGARKKDYEAGKRIIKRMKQGKRIMKMYTAFLTVEDTLRRDFPCLSVLDCIQH